MSGIKSGFIPADDYPKKSNITSKFRKVCPVCHGSGRDMPYADNYVIVPGMSENCYPKKNKGGLFKCERCGGSGEIPFIEPIIMTK